MRKPELLIPASSLEVLKTAVIFGADAVYIGGNSFGLRAKAKNFSHDDMKEGIEFAHAHGVKVHVTANILAHNDDLKGAEEYFHELKELGLVNDVVPHEQLLPAAAKIAGRIAKGPALALMLQKRVLRNAVSTSFEQNRDYEAISQIFASQTDDCREGLSAALERRRPEFSGK